MRTVQPSMRFKRNADTFYLPDPAGGVYIRNHEKSFRMEGEFVHQWVELLLPVLDGTRTLDELTNGLSSAYQERVYEIVDALYNHDFLRDISTEMPHQLSDEVLQTFAAQIEFLDRLYGSGAYHFQRIRESKVLVCGNGPMLQFLKQSLRESGVLHARSHEVMPDLDMDALISGYDVVLYASSHEQIGELTQVEEACQKANKLFIPAVCFECVGIAGPVVHSDTSSSWSSMWRRLHAPVVSKGGCHDSVGDTGQILLANALVFEMVKTLTGGRSHENHEVYILQFDTLESNWYSYVPHDAMVAPIQPLPTQNLLNDITNTSQQIQEADLMAFFAGLTDEFFGVFHLWDEQDLVQLPLSQCAVQSTEPLDSGLARLAPVIVTSGVTHTEARVRAGLIGIETYVLSQLNTALVHPALTDDIFSVGAGLTRFEAIWRGIQHCLVQTLRRQATADTPKLTPLDIKIDGNERLMFFGEVLQAIGVTPLFALGDELYGFPVVWAGTKDCMVGSVGLTVLMALEQAVEELVNRFGSTSDGNTLRHTWTAEITEFELKDGGISMPIGISSTDLSPTQIQDAIDRLAQHRIHTDVYDVTFEPFLKQGLAGVYGVSLRQEACL